MWSWCVRSARLATLSLRSARSPRAACASSGEALEQLLARGERELLQRLLRYRGECEPVSLRGRTAILVDDGLATGSSALAAVESLRRRGAARVILAVPVAAPQAARMLSRSADEVLCVEAPASLWAVGYWYEDFRPTRDEDITALLAERRAGGTQPADRSAIQPHHNAGHDG